MSIGSTGLSDWEFGRLLVKPKEACRLLACGNTRLYELIAAGELEAFLDGRSRKITTASIHRYIAQKLKPHTTSTNIRSPGRRSRRPRQHT
jgi:excisionase family DNA binding protein